jgi:FkbM family methyltransferase
MTRTIGDTSKWHADKGDLTHRLNYNLTKNSIVLDLGGYEGWFTEQINVKYGSKLFCFEPIKEYALLIDMKFKKFNNIKVFPFAVSNKNGKDIIYFNENSSSTHVITEKSQEIECMTLSKIMEDNNINNIDLIKINIEGEEYSLLEDMITNNLHKKCNNIQVQFHVIVDNYEMRYDYIKYELEKTHRLTYNYPFVWENWEKI